LEQLQILDGDQQNGTLGFSGHAAIKLFTDIMSRL